MPTESQFEFEKNEKGEVVKATLVKKRVQKDKPQTINPDAK